MVDERAEFTTDATPEDERPEPVERRGASWLLVAFIAIALVILVLLMLRGCSAVQSAVSRRSSTNQIVPVDGQRPVDGRVSIWLKADASIDQVLSRANITSSETIDMNGGRYVITVKPGTEVDAARAIRGIEGVYDAGRVYDGSPEGARRVGNFLAP